jgi:hypothetical protein
VYAFDADCLLGPNDFIRKTFQDCPCVHGLISVLARKSHSGVGKVMGVIEWCYKSAAVSEKYIELAVCW